MNLEIIAKPLHLNLHGFSGTAVNKDYAGIAFKLLDNMWKVVKTNNKGLNIWVYEPHEKVFAGIELEASPAHDTGLRQKSITLLKYAYYKHIGPYQLIKQTGQSMQEELKKRDIVITHPYLEIYGHWNSDETKLETELLMCI